jgi:hypothetical protein
MTNKNPFTMPLKEYYEEFSKEKLIERLLDQKKHIDNAEKTIVDQEIEIKELNRDLAQDPNEKIQALYKAVKDATNKHELDLKNFTIEREQHQNEVLVKDNEAKTLNDIISNLKNIDKK